MLSRRVRIALRLVGGATVLATALLFYFTRSRAVDNRALLGEEVYASHDCTDCHLALSVLRQKREKQQAGLIRARKSFAEVIHFLESDKRHESFGMLVDADRKNLVEFLRTLMPR